MEVVEIGGEYRLACNGDVFDESYKDRDRAEWIAKRMEAHRRRTGRA
jgi:hypothetical protein